MPYIFLESFDILSPKISFYYKGKLKHSSNYSGFLSILCIISILFLSLFFSEELLYRKNPTAFYYNRYSNTIHPIYYNTSGLFHLINIFSNSSDLELNRLFSIVGLENFMYEFNFSNLESFNHYIYDYCEENDIVGIEDSFNIILKDIKKYFCIKQFYKKDEQKLYNLKKKEYNYPSSIYGNSHPNMSIYGVVVLKCRNSSIINNNNCYSEDIINSELKNHFIGYSIDFLDHNIILENYKAPDIKIYHKITNLFNFGVGYTVHHLNFNPITLKTRDAFLFDNEKIIHTHKFNYNEKLISLFTEEEYPNYNILAAFYFWINNQEEIYVRTYKKIQDVLGSIIGVSKLILLICELINILIFNQRYLNDINSDICSQYKKQCLDYSSSCININTSSNPKGITNKTFSIVNKKIKRRLSKNSMMDIKKDIIANNFLSESNFQTAEKFQNVIWKKMKISIWKIIKNLFKKDLYISRIKELRQYIISEERMYKSYFFLKTVKGSINNYPKRKKSIVF